ncbi:hypothetical protein [Paracidobacterium acidisoli]|uniref:Uncharacterized protein n=1 Tax=Paracidobacterium acidisoli TaxID=2303751 RepID=A0A372IPI1_9BACT|nr:hypothetical protein [Paracidobacterium acidisoli]MBT9331124.1 hypothetical protein [Paracidobacterium acidisoli]
MELPVFSKSDASADPSSAPETRARILCGTLAALLVVLAFCNPPAHALSGPAIFLLAAGYICFATAAGFAGALIPRRRKSELGPEGESEWDLKRSPERIFERICLSGAAARGAALSWILLAPAVLLLREASMWALPVTAAASAALAVCLRRAAPEETSPSAVWMTYRQETPYFAEPLRFLPRRRMAVLSSICLHGTVLVLLIPAIFAGSVLLAAAVFGPAAQVAGWKAAPDEPRKNAVRATLRLTLGTVFALFILFLAMLPWLPGGTIPPGMAAVQDRAQAAARAASAAAKEASAGAPEKGFRAMILWPAPEKKPVVLPPVPHPVRSPLSRLSAPLVIPFNGPYWYSREPGKWPGANAHVAHGSPLTTKIHSTDWKPLLMAAHQQLGTAIDLNCCSRIELTIRNGDPHAESIAVGIYLTDSTLPGKPSQYLGAEPVLPGAEMGMDSGLSTARVREQTLTFPMRDEGRIRKFDEITVVYLTGMDHSTEGARIAVRSFTLFPRQRP